MDRRGFERIGRLLPEAVPQGGVAQVASLGRVWSDVVGESIAACASPARVTPDGTLVVHCNSSLWVSELEFLRPSILAKLQAAVGEGAPRALRFRVGPMPRVRPPREDRARRAAEPGRAATDAAARLAAPIADPKLRAAAQAAIARALARPPADPS